MRSNETVTADGSSANHNNPDMMDLGRGDDDVHFVDGSKVSTLGTATVIHKDEEMPYDSSVSSARGNGTIGGPTDVDSHGMKLEGDSDPHNPEKKDLSDDANNE
jgi:hypothetical protein